MAVSQKKISGRGPGRPLWKKSKTAPSKRITATDLDVLLLRNDPAEDGMFLVGIDIVGSKLWPNGTV